MNMNKNLFWSSSLFVLANLVMAFGILFWEWNMGMILVIFWLESGITLLFGILKMVYSEQGVSEVEVTHSSHFSKTKRARDVKVIAFYSVLLWFGAGLLLASILSNASTGTELLPMLSTLMNQLELRSLLLLFVFFIFSHTFSFITDYLPNERNLFSIVDLGVGALERTVVLLHSIIIYVFLSPFFNETRIFLLAFIVIKTISDIVIHRREHTKRAALVVKA
jgi:hypothetical protein